MWKALIGKFIVGRYTLVVILAAFLAIGLIWGHGYMTGKKGQQVRIIEKIVEAEKKSKRDSNETKKKIKSLDERKLDVELCSLGIVRQREAC